MHLPVTIAKLVSRRNIYCSRYLGRSERVHYLPKETKFENLFDQKKRFVSTTRCLWHGEYEWKDPKSEAEIVRVNFVNKDGKRTEVIGKIGDNVLYLAHR